MKKLLIQILLCWAILFAIFALKADNYSLIQLIFLTGSTLCIKIFVEMIGVK